MRRAIAARAGRCSAVLVLSLLVACGHAPVRPQAHAAQSGPRATVGDGSRAPGAGTASRIDPCAPTRIHRDSDYTPGGLYAPGVADGGPAAAIDVSALREPTPRREPRARTGNRSPYTVLGKVYRVLAAPAGYHERGLASWYGTKFNGRATSSGELYDICSFTAAHKTLPLPSYVQVTNLDNGRSLIVRVNDRGPFHDGRVMDLSYAAAVRLGVDRTGTAHVDLRAIDVDGDDPDDERPMDIAGTTPAPLRGNPPRSNPPGSNTPAPLPAQSAGALLGDPDATVMVQVASFGEQVNAQRLADRLADSGLSGLGIEPGDAGGRPVWRVRIGPLSEDAAIGLVDRLHDMNLPGARVLRR